VPVIPLLLDGARCLVPMSSRPASSGSSAARPLEPGAQPGFDYDTQPAFKVLDPTLTEIPPSRAHLSRGRAERAESENPGWICGAIRL
jgi:hypothetical protein